MTEKETIKIITLIVMSYPAADKFKDDNTVKAMVGVWSRLFADDDPGIVELAVQRHIVTSKWPPSIAEVREQMATLVHPEIVPPDIAWTAVSDLLYSVGEFDHKSAYKALPPLIAGAVEAIGWSTLYQMHCGHGRGTKDGMDRVTFLQQYTPMYERERERAMLPKAVDNAVRKAQDVFGRDTMLQLAAVRQRRFERDRMLEAWASESQKRLIETYLPETIEKNGTYEG